MTPHTLSLSAAALGILTLGAGARIDTSPTEYRGAYQRGFEQSWFVPCDSPRDDKLWWVTLTDEALDQRDSILKTITAEPTNGLAVRWVGTVSDRMRAGQMGRGTRYLLVTKIVDIRPMPEQGACAPVTNTASAQRR